jgi:predicted HD superfamily hydrolase involved in NAD metabolism
LLFSKYYYSQNIVMNESQPLRSQVLTWLQAEVPESRIRHILRVETMAIDLAGRHGIDPEKASQAAIMHDLAKFFKPERLLAMATDHGVAIDPVTQAAPHLLHAEVGAIVAREVFQVTDKAVLAAIANHTMGQPGMDTLSCIVYLADGLEPGRGKTDELNALRKICQKDLKEAMWRSADFSLQYLLRSQQLIHPRTVMTRNWFLQEVNSPT